MLINAVCFFLLPSTLENWEHAGLHISWPRAWGCDSYEVEGGWTALPDLMAGVKYITQLDEVCQTGVFILPFSRSDPAHSILSQAEEGTSWNFTLSPKPKGISLIVNNYQAPSHGLLFLPSLLYEIVYRKETASWNLPHICQPGSPQPKAFAYILCNPSPYSPRSPSLELLKSTERLL